MSNAEELIGHFLADWRAGWSMGSFGAIAEFHRDEGEPTRTETGARLAAVTGRGGVAFDRVSLSNVTPVAFEALSPKAHRWSHGITLCLPAAAAAREARSVLSEIGPDHQALRPLDSNGIMFDLGLALPQCDFCVRTEDDALVAILRENLGRSLFDPNNTALGPLLSAHPHRIAITAVGRVEVFQKIGGPETGGVSPAGPHTHLLPKLLRSGRTHSANTPVPDGYLPVASLHPANPVMDPLGRDQDFDAGLHAEFQELLARTGWPDSYAAKQAVIRAVAQGQDADRFAMPPDRFGRAAIRVALRQQTRIAERANDPALLDRLKVWRRVHDGAGDETDEDAPGHQ